MNKEDKESLIIFVIISIVVLGGFGLLWYSSYLDVLNPRNPDIVPEPSVAKYEIINHLYNGEGYYNVRYYVNEYKIVNQNDRRSEIIIFKGWEAGGAIKNTSLLKEEETILRSVIAIKNRQTGEFIYRVYIY